MKSKALLPHGPWGYEHRGTNGLEMIYQSEECGRVAVHVSGTHLGNVGERRSKVRFSTHIKFDPNVRQPWRHILSSQGGFLAGIGDLEKKIKS